MPVSTIGGAASVFSVVADQTVLTVGELEACTIFKIFDTPQGVGTWNSAGRMYVKAGNGHGANDRLLKARYNGDIAPLAIVLPLSADDNRAFTPATQRLTADTRVMKTFGKFQFNG